MLMLKQMPWLIGADWKHSQVDRAKHLAYFLEDFAVGGVSRVEDLLPLRCLDHEASPQPLVLVTEPPLGLVSQRDEGYFEFLAVYLQFFGVCPVKLVQLATLGHAVVGVKPSAEDRMVKFVELLHCCLVEVVVVVMTQENCVNRREFVDLAGRLPVPCRASPLEWRCSVGEDRINEEVDFPTD